MSNLPAGAPAADGQAYCPACERMYPVGELCPTDGTRLVRIKAVVDPLIGRVLDGRYTIKERLGQGGMGAVYRAAQHSVDREVAVKVVNPHLMTNNDAIRRFLREAKIASKLSHPNAVQVLDFGQSDDGLFYLVMELVSGRTLDQVLAGDRALRPERLVRIGVQVCDALESAHALQIVHRDLKPANIMLLAQGRDHVKVLDFGLAKSVATDQAVTTMTNAGALLGTPAYMPPELALGMPCDGRADLYALGCVLYQMGSGRLPYISDSAHELVAMHGSSDPVPPISGVPHQLALVIHKLLEKEPARRFQTAAEAREALEASFDRNSTPLTYRPDSQPAIAAFATPPPGHPRAMSEAQMHVANAVTIAERRPRRWVVPILAAFAIAGGSVGAIVATRDTSSAPAMTEPAASPPAVPLPPAHVEPAATVEPPPAAPVAPPPPETGSAAPTTQPVTTPEPTATRPAETTTRPKRPKVLPKPVTKPRPPTPTPTPVPPPTTKPGDMPF